jgi:hypothetical protein
MAELFNNQRPRGGGVDVAEYPTETQLSTDDLDAAEAISLDPEEFSFSDNRKVVLSRTSPLYIL